MSGTTDWLQAIGSVLGAVGTIGAVIVALFQDQLRSWLFPRRVSLSLRDPTGELTYLNQEIAAHYFHIRVKNETSRPLHRCRLLLVEITVLMEDGKWTAVEMPVPLPFTWGLAEIQPLDIDIRGDETATGDFGYFTRAIDQNTNEVTVIFNPTLATYPANFKGRLVGKGTMRFHVELRADELSHPCYATFEVVSTGKWSETTAALSTVLHIRRVNAPKALNEATTVHASSSSSS